MKSAFLFVSQNVYKYENRHILAVKNELEYSTKFMDLSPTQHLFSLWIYELNKNS